MEPPPLSSINRARQSLVRGLAESFLSGRWDIDGLAERGSQLLGRRYRWLRPLALRVLASFTDDARPRVARLVDFLWKDEPFRKACRKQRLGFVFANGRKPRWHRRPGPRPHGRCRRSLRRPGWLVFSHCSRPSSTGSLIARPANAPPRWKHSGITAIGGLPSRRARCRLIEAPKPRLKQLQRRVLDEILVHIPPHEAAHGFRPGRSVLSFVEPHVGQTIVLKMDLRDFFVSITSGRVMAIFLTAGYPEPVARLLTGLCTNTVPLMVWNQARSARARPISICRGLAGPAAVPSAALAAGAPTSPALANLAAHRLDARLAGLARAAGASYTRYADDLVFSGGESFARSIARFPTHVAAIALEEGFAVQHRKTRVMRQGVRQRPPAS